MKTITKIALLLLLCFKLQAQNGYIAAGTYPKLYDITYDATVQNKLYARTLSNHIVVSLNNGTDWTVLYSHPLAMENLKLVPGGTSLSFSTAEGIFIFSTVTNTVSSFYEIPASNVEGAGASWITSYSLYNGTGTAIVVNTGYQVGFSNEGKTFYSDDSGVTWTQIYYTVENANIFVNSVAIAPNNTKKIFLARGNGNTDVDGGLLISTDAGLTWTESLAGIVLDPIAFKPSNGEEMLVGTGISFGEYPEGVYRSTDGGLNWAPFEITFDNVTLNNIIDIAYNPINENKIMVLEENEIIKTEDGGLTWVSGIYTPDSLNYYYGLNASYNPFNENQVVISTDYYPQISNDGGVTLTQLHAPFYDTASASVSQEGTVTHLYYGSQGGFSHKNLSTEATEGYDILGPNVFTSSRTYAVADPVVAGRVFTLNAGGFNGATLSVSTTYGAAPIVLMNTYTDQIQQLAVDPANTNIVYLSLRSGDNSSLYKINLSNTENITPEEILTPGEGGVVTGIIISSTDSAAITIAKGTNLYQTTDGGVNWTDMLTDLPLDASANIIWEMIKNPINPNNYLIASNVGIFSSSDAGATWTVALADVNVRKIEYSTLNENVAVAAIYSGEAIQASLVYTVDGGASWTAISPEQLKYIYTSSVDFSFTADSLTAYIATSDLGVMTYTINDLDLGITQPGTVKNTVALYPNPASNQFTVSASSSSFGIKSIAVYTITGQQLLQTTENTVDVSGLSNGIYIVKTETTNGLSVSQKLVKE